MKRVFLTLLVMAMMLATASVALAEVRTSGLGGL